MEACPRRSKRESRKTERALSFLQSQEAKRKRRASASRPKGEEEEEEEVMPEQEECAGEQGTSHSLFEDNFLKSPHLEFKHVCA